MGTKDFRLFIDRVRMQALAAGQKTTLAHLVVQALDGLLRRDPANQTFLAARSELADRIISKTVFNEAEKTRVRQQPSTIDTFQPDLTARELAAFAVKKSTGHGFDADVLAGLLALENYDGQPKETSTLWHAQEICRRHGVTRRLSLPTAAATPAEKILEVIDDRWLYARTRTTIQGREQELRRGLAQLAAVFKKGAPLVITGARRVGKSLFLHHLLHRASNQWTHIAGHGIAKPTFLHVGKEAFLGNEQDVRNRLLEWHTHLCQHPEQVPVVDDFSHFRNPALPIARVFQETLGGMLASGGRTFVLVTDETGLRDELLGSAQRLVLKPLDPHSTVSLIATRLQSKLTEFEQLPAPLAIATEPMGFSRELVALATEFYPGDAFPALGFDLVERFLDWYAGMVLVGDDAARYNGTATLADLKAFIAQDRGLEALDVDYTALARALKTDVIGQDHVITQVCRVLDYRHKISRAQLRPKGRFLFLGPPGVGKTQLAKRLAVRLFGTTPLRYNMSDFGGEGDRWRFIGSPRGYVGSEKRTLFDEVRENPNCVLLLDEIDRAHASIQDILLSMLEGEAVDGDHNTVYFSNVVFVMTTNLAKGLPEN